MKKTIIGLLTGLALVGFISCKGEVESGAGGNISTPYTKVGEQTIGETTYEIVTFGTFPQSEKTDDTISVDETDSKTVGSFTYYKGSDGEWYAERNSKYYKVEPIKWRVLTTDYDHDDDASTSGKKLLLAENILINKAYHASSNNYENSSIRAYLIGDFLTIAFTAQEQAAIAPTNVVNDARSTNPDSNATEFNGGVNIYASDNTTEDKIFLLSVQEATKEEYGFAAYDTYGAGNTRIRMTTAFARANGAYQKSTAGYGGYWRLRSPNYNNSNDVRFVYYDGDAGNTYCSVSLDSVGVVPALCLK